MANEHVQSASLRLIVAKGTDTGRKRDHNEDYVEAFRPSDPGVREQKGELFILADGMGGHQAGEVASEKAVQTTFHEYYADPNPNVATALSAAIERANGLIHQQAQESLSRIGMGTTVVAAVARGNELVLANVGDSRAYLLRNGRLKQITRDHSFVEEQIRAGILTREEARTHPQRNVITRALGAKPEVEVDTYGGTLAPGDILLLCSDGLSEPVGDRDIEGVLRQYPPGEAVPRLISLANGRGGTDNISALVVWVAPTGEATAVLAAPGRAGDEDTTEVSVADGRAAEETRGERRLSVPAILALGAGGLLLLTAVAAAAIFLLPTLRGGRETPTATPSPPPPSATPTQPPPATTQAAEETTATPRAGFGALEPADGAVFSPGDRVLFRWNVVGRLPALYDAVVRTNDDRYAELCPAGEEPCTLPEDPGTYTWWIELRTGGTVILKSDPRNLIIESAMEDTPEPPATTSGPASPLETPAPSGDG